MMKKIIFTIIAFLAFGNSHIFAQNYNNGQVTTKIITGTVHDKAGAPVAGAFVYATNGAETVETDTTGYFSIEVPVWLKYLSAAHPDLDSMMLPLKDRTEVHFKFSKKLSSKKKKDK